MTDAFDIRKPGCRLIVTLDMRSFGQEHAWTNDGDFETAWDVAHCIRAALEAGDF